MVVTPHAAATLAGVRVLEGGGNAIDAATAADLGLRIRKLGMIWPLEPEGAHQRAANCGWYCR